MKAFLIIDEHKFFIGIEDKDLSSIAQNEKVFADLFLSQKSDVKYIDKTTIVLSVLNDNELNQFYKNTKNVFCNFVKSGDFKLLIIAYTHNKKFSYEIILSLHTYNLILKDLELKESSDKIFYLKEDKEESFIKFLKISAEHDTNDNWVVFEAQEEKFLIQN